MTRVEHRPIATFILLLVTACGAPARSPWQAASEAKAVPAAEVTTLNGDYRRLESTVLVRQVEHPTRAALDYAAYHKNFMIADPPPEPLPDFSEPPDTAAPFGGLIEKSTLTGDATATGLSSEELSHPLAFTPMVEFLSAKSVSGADALLDVRDAVRGEWWGYASMPGVFPQTISEAFVHRPAQGAPEMWVRIETKPWFSGLGPLSDQDGDGVPEVYGRIAPAKVPASLLDAIAEQYVKPVLSAAEVKKWANELSSYWYPSYNTDLVPASEHWPDTSTEPNIVAQLKGQVFERPSFVLRGKPQGKPTYAVFIVEDMNACDGEGCEDGATDTLPEVQLAATKTSAKTDTLLKALNAELKANGGSYEAWAKKLGPFHKTLGRRLAAAPETKAFAGSDGFLFFRNSLSYVIGGDLTAQPQGKNPLPVILEFKRQLDELGVDFLFVPVPTKAEVFPDKLDPAGARWVGKVVNPFQRKLLLQLSQQGVEVLDLLPRFLAERKSSQSHTEDLYQRQDTHWTNRGLQLAAEMCATRIAQYPWYSELTEHEQEFSLRATTFTRFGDLHSRLSDAEQSAYKPETLSAEQVLTALGAEYDDQSTSPIVVLGDSFTGVYELTDAEHAGVSAHLAKRVRYPVDLVMSYGGGPNVRQKLFRRGRADLAKKKLVIWMMTSRDLHDYWEDWESLPLK